MFRFCYYPPPGVRARPIFRKNMESLLNVALIAARAAARNLAHGVDQLDRVKVLNDSEDAFCTSMDRDSERTLIYQIEKLYPKHRIESRLSGVCGGADESVVWLLEPLAGSRNFFSGLSAFGVAVGCRVKGILSHAAVVLPQTNEEFSASRGQGAQLNSRRIRVGGETRPRGALLGLHADSGKQRLLHELQQRLRAEQALLRQSGCAVFDIAQTAANRLQGGWSGANTGCGQLAAGLVLTEAGGLLVGESGSPDVAAAGETLYGNPRMVRALLRIRAEIDGS